MTFGGPSQHKALYVLWFYFLMSSWNKVKSQSTLSCKFGRHQWPWQSVQKIFSLEDQTAKSHSSSTLSSHGCVSLHQFCWPALFFLSPKGYDRYAAESQCSPLLSQVLFLPISHGEDHFYHYSNILLSHTHRNLFSAKFIVGTSNDQTARTLGQGLSSADGCNQKHVRRWFLECRKSLLLVLSSKQHRNCLSGFVLVPVPVSLLWRALLFQLINYKDTD